MESMTVAEALGELKRINKLLQKRFENIRRYASKRKGSDDEIENQKDFVRSQHQSAIDLIRRYMKIKLAINESNLKTYFDWKGESITVAEAILFKQKQKAQFEELLNCFTPDRGNGQIREYLHAMGVMQVKKDFLETADLVPELMYNEEAIRLAKEHNIDFYAHVDVMIDAANHGTTIFLDD